jgi:hypothetical protein
MSQIDPQQELLRLESLYGQKSDEELLALQAQFQSLTEVGQSALQAELEERKLWPGEGGLQPEYPTEPIASENLIFRGARAFGFVLLNLFVAVFGTAIVETLLGHIYHPRTISAVLIKTDLLSALCGFALGFVVSRRWNPRAARWIGLFGVVWFFLGACIDLSHGSVWSRMSGIECGEGLHAGHCMEWFVFSLPAVRSVFYSAGAWLCWSLSAHGTSPMEDAIVGRFKVPSHFGQS